MSAAITEPAPQVAIIPAAAAMAPTAGSDGPADGFMAMLAAVLDTKMPPPVAAADPPTVSPKNIEGPAIPPLATARVPPAGGAPAPPGPVTPLAVPPPVISASPAADLAHQAVPATPAAKAPLTKLATSTGKSIAKDTDPILEIAPPTSFMPPVLLPPLPPIQSPVLSPITAPAPDPAVADFAPDPAAATMSVPANAPAAPLPPAPAEAANAQPLSVKDPAKPRDRVADHQIAFIPDRLPDAPAVSAPVAAPSHNAPAPEAIPVHVATVLSGAPPVQPIAPQAGAAFVVLARAGDGAHHLTLLLQPPDLGELRIAVEQSRNGPPKIAVTAVNPATLLTLLRDQPALNKALDSAGIIGDGRVVTFHLASASDPAPVAATSSSKNPGDAPQSHLGGENSGIAGQSPQTQSGAQFGPDAGGGQRQRPARHEPPAHGWFAEMTQIEPPPPPSRMTLAGIDITA